MLQNKRTFKHRRLAALLLASSTLTLSSPALACGSDPLMGEVCMFAFDFCPYGYLEANGQILQVAQYTALYSLLGTRFGGTAGSTFALPDLRGRTMIGRGLPTGESTYYQLGSYYGSFATQLTTAQLPTHSHTATLTAGSQTITASLPVSTLVGSSTGTLSALANGQTGYLAGISGKVGVPSVNFTGPYTATAPVAGSMATLPVTASVSGGSVTVAPTPTPTAKVPTVTPSVTMTACIAAEGIYPTRP
jgi:microcystin-dependent protein